MVHPSVPAKTVKELIALLQANPGKYAIANSGLGTTPQLAAELFKLTFKLDQPSVPYAGGAPAIQRRSPDRRWSALPHLTPADAADSSAARCAALAVTSRKRSGAVPDVPTMRRSRHRGPGIRNHAGRVRFRPERHRPIVDLLNREIVKALSQPDVQEKCKQARPRHCRRHAGGICRLYQEGGRQVAQGHRRRARIPQIQ